MKIKVNWDTDNEVVDLPEIVEVPNKIAISDVSDWLSDNFGWCVNSWVKFPDK